MPCCFPSKLRCVTVKDLQKTDFQQPQQNGVQKSCVYGTAQTAFRSPILKRTTVPPSHRAHCDSWFRLRGLEPEDVFRKYQRRMNAPPTQNQPRGREIILATNEVNRMKMAAKVVTINDRLDALVKKEAEQKKVEQETRRIYDKYKKIDNARKAAVEARAARTASSSTGEKTEVLEKAFIAKYDQDVDMKRINGFILNAECHAVLDDQLKDNMDRAKAFKNEETRLEKMVLDNALRALMKEDVEKQQRLEIQKQYGKDIRDQLREREHMRYMEAERVVEEGEKIRKEHEEFKRLEELQAKLVKERKVKYRAELDSNVKTTNLFRAALCDYERQTDIRNREYVRTKREHERALKNAMNFENEEMERKRYRLLVLGEKALEAKLTREEMAFQREQERLMRETIIKEKEAEERQKQKKVQMREGLDLQMEESKNRNALQIKHDAADFNMMTDNIRKQDTKAEEEEKIKNERNRNIYRQDIIRQMCDNEYERRRSLESKYNETFAWRQSERQREADIRAVVNSKLSGLRGMHVPDEYIDDVEVRVYKIDKNYVPKK